MYHGDSDYLSYVLQPKLSNKLLVDFALSFMLVTWRRRVIENIKCV